MAGHIRLHRAMQFFGGAFFMTFLRDPVARVQSQYRTFHDPAKLSEQWRSRMSDVGLRAIEFAQQASFEEFILADRPGLRGHLNNLQTVFLADAGLKGRAALDSAIRNLAKRIGFFGIQERFEDSLVLFRIQTGSNRINDVPEEQRNRSIPANLALSAKGQARLAELVALDIELYRAACRLFRWRFAEARWIWRPLRRAFSRR